MPKPVVTAWRLSEGEWMKRMRWGHFNHLSQQTISSRARCVFAVTAAAWLSVLRGSGCCLFPSHYAPPSLTCCFSSFHLSPGPPLLPLALPVRSLFSGYRGWVIPYEISKNLTIFPLKIFDFFEFFPRCSPYPFMKKCKIWHPYS